MKENVLLSQIVKSKLHRAITTHSTFALVYHILLYICFAGIRVTYKHQLNLEYLVVVGQALHQTFDLK